MEFIIKAPLFYLYYPSSIIRGGKTVCMCVCVFHEAAEFLRVLGYYYYFLRFRLARQEVLNFNRIILIYNLFVLELFEVLDS